MIFILSGLLTFSIPGGEATAEIYEEHKSKADCAASLQSLLRVYGKDKLELDRVCEERK